MQYSTRVYEIYLKYIAAEDIHVYSVDEVFMDVTAYLPLYGMTAHELAMTMIRDVLHTTGITATAGIGTNLYLCKIAMDIVAKKMPADADGVRIAELDEQSYRRQLWTHRPLTDFWRVGKGYARKLQERGLYTMGDIARCSLGKDTDYYNAELLYRLFGVNAELLIDHAWGIEPCTIRDIKAYRPESSSLSAGQVLSCAYTAEKAGLILREMTEQLSLELTRKELMTDQLVLTVNYDIDNLKDPQRLAACREPLTEDFYGRQVPKPAHGTVSLPEMSDSSRMLTEAGTELYHHIVNPALLVRRLTVAFCHLKPKAEAAGGWRQMDLTEAFPAEEANETGTSQAEKNRRAQEAALEIQRRFGKNAVLKGMSLEEGATGRQRNEQIGGHRA